MAATLLAVGAGEAFREDRERDIPESMKSTLQNHADAGDTLRLTMVLLTLVLVDRAVHEAPVRRRSRCACSPCCSRSSRSSS